MQDIHTLITKELPKAQEEKKVELIYRSCIDLMSTMIVLRLGENGNQARFINDKSVIFPKVISNPGLEKNSSNILVEKSGKDALNAGLTFLNKPIKKYKYHPPMSGFRLKTVLSQGKVEEEKKDIAVYFELGNKRDKAIEVSKHDDVACVGRISETLFDLDQDEIKRLNADVIEWCKNVSNEPKTLCIDLTITKQNDELVTWMQSPDIKRLIQEKKLDILVWQSEQKQHSLGTGKFSAGSVYLLSGDADKVAEFNKDVSIAYNNAPDNNLSTFFRHFCLDAMHAVVKQQTESARFIADQLNPGLEKCYGAKAIANGPFVTIMVDKQQKPDIESLLQEVWPQSNSFGFSQTTITSWEDSFFRISLGLESQKTLSQEVSEIIASFKTPQAQPR